MNVSGRILGGIILTIFTIGIITTGALEQKASASGAHEWLVRGFEAERDGAGRTQYISRTLDSTVVLRGGEATLTLADHAVRMTLVGATQPAHGEPTQELGGVSHYLIGNEPAAWRTNVKAFGKVRFHEVYRGVDLVYSGLGQTLAYDFIVSPGAKTDGIRLHFDGTDRVTLDDDGGLRLHIGARAIRMDPPRLGRFTLDRSGDVGFQVDASKHDDNSVTIDPVIVYSTYFGGRGIDAASAVAVDDQGFIYLTGRTGNVDNNTFPTVHALQPDFHAFSAAFVTKLTPDGRAVVYSTYFGGRFSNEGRAIAVDRKGRVYVAGITSSEDFPMVNAVQPTCGGFTDGFVAKLNAAGSGIEYSTCLGGQSNEDELFGMTIDEAGNAYVTGFARSREFPTQNALQPFHAGGDRDAFLSVIKPDGRDFVYSTFLGGTGEDEGHGVAIDNKHNVYVTGKTTSTDFPLRDPYQPDLHGPSDAFVAKIDRKGQQILYSTYLGGSVGLSDDGIPLSRGGDETGMLIAVDDRGSATVAGRTNSSDLPTLHAAQRHLGGPQHPALGFFTTDAFVARFDPTGTATYVTYAGGNGNDVPTAMALDDDGLAWITGTTESADFPTVHPEQASFGDGLVFSSRDDAASWRAAGGGIGGRDVRAVVVDPHDPSVIYAGTNGGGVYKSHDHGRRWIAVNAGLGNLFVTGLVIDANNPSRLLAATDGGGVFRSLDRGATWRRSSTSAPMTALAIAPSNPSVVYAGAAARGFGAVFTTTDFGETWSKGTFTDLVRGITVDPVTPTTVYTATNSALFKSIDGGQSFAFLPITSFFLTANTFAIDPSSPSTVYAGTEAGMLKSLDGGVTWTFLSGFRGGLPHALAISAADPLTIYAGSDNGVFKSIDAGGTWTAANVGLTSPLVNTLVFAPGNSGTLYVGALGTTDTFVMAFGQNGSLRYSSFFGGNSAEAGGGLAINGRRIYLAGGTSSTDFVTVDPVQSTDGGLGDAFLTIFRIGGPHRFR